MSKPRTAAGRQLLRELRTVRNLFNGRKADPGLLLDVVGLRIAAIEADYERPPLICAACGGTNDPVVMVPLHPYHASQERRPIDPDIVSAQPRDSESEVGE